MCLTSLQEHPQNVKVVNDEFGKMRENLLTRLLSADAAENLADKLIHVSIHDPYGRAL